MRNNLNSISFGDIDSNSIENDFNYDYFDSHNFLEYDNNKLSEDIECLEQRLFYQEQKLNHPEKKENKFEEIDKDKKFDECENKNKSDLYKREEMTNLKKTEETAATDKEKKNEIETGINENNNELKKNMNQNKNITKVFAETKNINEDKENNNNSNINEKNKEKFLKKKRKKKDSKNGNNNKLKRVRLMILNSILRFINKKVKKAFNNNIGKGIVKKQFVNFSREKLTHSSVEFDKTYLNKKLEEIFSSHISGKYTNYLKNKNEELVNELINLEDKGDYFKAIFELTFLDCIQHINGTKTISLLDDFETLDEILLNEKDIEDEDEDDIENYRETIEHYKDYVENKNSRKPRKNHDKINL